MSLRPAVAALDVLLAATPEGYGRSELGPTITKAEDNDTYVPTAKVVETNLAGVSNARRLEIVNAALQVSKTYRDAALSEIRGKGWITERFNGGIDSVTKPTPKWPRRAGFTSFTYLLDVKGISRTPGNVETIDTKVAWDALATWSTSTPYTGPADASTVAALLKSLVNFRSVYGRVLAAARAAFAVPNVSLPQMLALYRTEGDFLFPPSAGSLDRGGTEPVGRVDHQFKYEQDWPWVGTCALIYDQAKVAAYPVDVIDIRNLPERTLYTDMMYQVAIAGLDQVLPRVGRADSRREDLLYALDPTISVPVMWNDSLVAFTDELYKAAGQDPDSAAAFDDARIQLLNQRTEGGAFIFAPLDSLAYVTSVLTVAARVFKLYQQPKVLNLPDSIGLLPDMLAYLLYHIGPGRTRRMLRSALFHAKSANTEQARQLKTRFATLLSDATEAATVKPDLSIGIDHWKSRYVPLLSGEGNLSALMAFIRTASWAVWDSWDFDETKRKKGGVRTNILRFEYALQFYNSCFVSDG